MKILKTIIDSKSSSGSLKLIPTCSDDLYILNDIISPGDVIEAFTTRKISMDGGKSQQKISLIIAIKIETFETDLEDGLMYVKGKTCKEYDYIKLSSYHTLNLSLNEEFTITKDIWSEFDLRKLKDTENESLQMCFIVFYEKDCVVSTVSTSGISVIYKEEIKNKNIKNLLNIVLNLKNNIKTYILAGFSDLRNDFFKVLIKENKSIEKKCSNIKLSSDYKNIPNSKVINKMLVDINFTKSFSDIAYVDDLREIESFFLELDQGKKGCLIGVEEVKEACEYGALKTLFVTDQFCKPRTVEDRKKNDQFINEAKVLRAKICVVPLSNDHGERLKTMGSVAGKLLFEYK